MSLQLPCIAIAVCLSLMLSGLTGCNRTNPQVAGAQPLDPPLIPPHRVDPPPLPDGRLEDPEVARERLAPDQEHVAVGAFIPPDARLVARGRGGLSFRAPVAGQMWLWDEDRRLVLDARRLHKDDSYAIAPRLSRATLNGIDVDLDQRMLARSTHRIYFQPG